MDAWRGASCPVGVAAIVLVAGGIGRDANATEFMADGVVINVLFRGERIMAR